MIMGTIEIKDIIQYGLPAVLYIIGLVVSYTKLNSKVESIEAELKQKIADLQSLKDDVKEINKTLNQIVGKIDLFFNKFCETK